MGERREIDPRDPDSPPQRDDRAGESAQATPHLGMSHRLWQLPFYGTAFFSLSTAGLIGVELPLWAAIHFRTSASETGLILSSTALLPLVYAVPAGRVIDALGPRKVLGCTAAVQILLSGAYALAPSVATLVLIQLLYGLMQAVSWQSAQTWAMTSTISERRSRAAVVGRFSAVSTAGTVVGPLLLGLAADRGLRWGFAVMGGWSACLGASTLLCREPVRSSGGRFSASFLLPRVETFRSAFGLLRQRAIVFVMILTFLRIASSAMRSSFYPIILHARGLSVSQVGALVSIGSLASALSAASVGKMATRARFRTVGVSGIALAVASMSLVPVHPSFWIEVLLALGFGFGIGVTLPVALGLLSKSVPDDQAGLAVGLRSAMNRLASLATPSVIGGLASGVGMVEAFYAFGALLVAGAVVAAVAGARWQVQ